MSRSKNKNAFALFMKLLKFAQAKCKMYIIQSKKDGRYYSFILQ